MAVLLLGEGLAVEVVLSTGLCVSAGDAVIDGAGLGTGAATGGELVVLGSGLDLLALATRFGGLFVALLTVGSCGLDALAGMRLDASSLGLACVTLVAAFSTVEPVLATVTGDVELDSVMLAATGATRGAVPEGVK